MKPRPPFPIPRSAAVSSSTSRSAWKCRAGSGVSQPSLVAKLLRLIPRRAGHSRAPNPTPIPALQGRNVIARGDPPGKRVPKNIPSRERATQPRRRHQINRHAEMFRPFRTGRLLGHRTRGVAPGYHIAPFQGCRNSTSRPPVRAEARRAGGVEEVAPAPSLHRRTVK